MNTIKNNYYMNNPLQRRGLNFTLCDFLFRTLSFGQGEVKKKKRTRFVLSLSLF